MAIIARDCIPYAQCGFAGNNSFYLVTADGKTIGTHDRYASEVLRLGFEAWDRLPEAERKPRAVSGVPRVAAYPKPPEPPKNSLILKIYIRALQRDESGTLTHTGPLTAAEGYYDLPAEPQLDHLWLTESEWKSLIPAEPRAGDVIAVPPRVARRIAKYHLIDKGTGCKVFVWDKATAEMKLKVSEVTPTSVRMELSGTAHIGQKADYPLLLQGRLEVDRRRGEFTRFDMLAIGRDDGDLRPEEERLKRFNFWYRLHPGGKLVMAVAFELVDGIRTLDRVPPYALMWGRETMNDGKYLKAE